MKRAVTMANVTGNWLPKNPFTSTLSNKPGFAKKLLGNGAKNARVPFLGKSSIDPGSAILGVANLVGVTSLQAALAERDNLVRPCQ